MADPTAPDTAQARTSATIRQLLDELRTRGRADGTASGYQRSGYALADMARRMLDTLPDAFLDYRSHGCPLPIICALDETWRCPECGRTWTADFVKTGGILWTRTDDGSTS